MRLKESKTKRRISLIFLLLPLLLGVQAHAVNYSQKAGCVTQDMGLNPVGTVLDQDGSTPLLVGSRVEYISIGSNARIDGPDMNGAVTPDDVLVQSSGTAVGNDTAGNNFQNVPGKFWHSITGSLGGGVTNNFYVRAWNKNPSAPDAYFGESWFGNTGFFTAQTASVGYPVPGNSPLNDFATLFPKAAPIGDMDPSVTVTVRLKTVGHSADIRWKTAFGARKYLVHQVNAQGNIISTKYEGWNSQGRCSPNQTDIKSWEWTGLDELTTYNFRVEAWNTFGSTFSDVIAFDTPEFPDPNPPETVRDLKAEVTKNDPPYEVKLTWTAPADLDKGGQRVNVSGYEIKAATPDPLLVAPNAQPDPIDTFKDAETVADLGYTVTPNLTPSGDPANPNPNVVDFDSLQEITISDIPSGGLYFFAVKGVDEAVGGASNTGDISNLAAANLGVTAGVAPLRFTLQSISDEKLIVNSISIPYELVDAQGNRVTDAEGLINLINAKSEAAGKPGDNVIVIGKWDPDMGAVGLKPDGEGTNFDLVTGEGYQLYVNEGFELVLP